MSKDQVLNALDKFEIEKISVLGGDVYELNDGKPESNYNNWHCDRKPDESLESIERNQVGTRAGGVVQMGVGALEGVTGVGLSPTCTTVVTCAAAGLLILHGIDNVHAGAMTLWTGEQYSTMLNAAFQNKAGLSPQQALYAEIVLNVVTGGAAILGNANRLRGIASTGTQSSKPVT